MLNWGNAEKCSDFAMGYGRLISATYYDWAEAAEFAQKIDSLLARNASKTDWDFVQSIFDIYESYKPRHRKAASRNIGEAHGKWTVPEPIATPHGEYRGGHFPIIYDKRRAFIGPDNLATDKGPFDNGMLPEDYFKCDDRQAVSQVSNRVQQSRVLFTSNTMEVGMRFPTNASRSVLSRGVYLSRQGHIRPAIRQAITNHYMGKPFTCTSWIA